MTVDIAENQIRALEGRADGFHETLLFFAFLVVVGVVLECGKELIHWSADVIAGIRKRPTEGHKLTLGLLGGVLVAIGVAGELYVEHRSHAVESELRKANDVVATQLKKELAVAQRAAAEAKQNALSAMGNYERLKKESVDAQSALLDRLRQSQTRSKLILESGFGRDKTVTAFAGQKVKLILCTDPRGLDEKEGVMLALSAELHRAQWQTTEESRSCSGDGLFVERSKRAGAMTVKAADALARALERALYYRGGRYAWSTIGKAYQIRTDLPPNLQVPIEPTDPETVVIIINGPN